MLTDVREVGRAQNAGTCVTWEAGGGTCCQNAGQYCRLEKGFNNFTKIHFCPLNQQTKTKETDLRNCRTN